MIDSFSWLATDLNFLALLSLLEFLAKVLEINSKIMIFCTQNGTVDYGGEHLQVLGNTNEQWVQWTRSWRVLLSSLTCQYSIHETLLHRFFSEAFKASQLSKAASRLLLATHMWTWYPEPEGMETVDSPARRNPPCSSHHRYLAHFLKTFIQWQHMNWALSHMESGLSSVGMNQSIFISEECYFYSILFLKRFIFLITVSFLNMYVF